MSKLKLIEAVPGEYLRYLETADLGPSFLTGGSLPPRPRAVAPAAFEPTWESALALGLGSRVQAAEESKR
jgi:hypothetical protein